MHVCSFRLWWSSLLKSSWIRPLWRLLGTHKTLHCLIKVLHSLLWSMYDKVVAFCTMISHSELLLKVVNERDVGIGIRVVTQVPVPFRKKIWLTDTNHAFHTIHIVLGTDQTQLNSFLSANISTDDIVSRPTLPASGTCMRFSWKEHVLGHSISLPSCQKIRPLSMSFKWFGIVVISSSWPKCSPWKTAGP